MTEIAKQPHYNAHGSGVECLDVVKDLPFSIGNVIKYSWRYSLKNGLEDLKKALVYIERCNLTEDEHTYQMVQELGANEELDFLVEKVRVLEFENPFSPLYFMIEALHYGLYGDREEYFRNIKNTKNTLENRIYLLENPDGDI